MSFIFNLFSSNPSHNASAQAEKENAAAFKAILNDHKSALKVECKRYKAEYKQAMKEADIAYKQAQAQAKDDFFRKILGAVKRDVDVLSKTEAFEKSDAKTKGKVECFRVWMNSQAAEGCLSVGGVNEKDGGVDSDAETVIGVVVDVDEKKVGDLKV